MYPCNAHAPVNSPYQHRHLLLFNLSAQNLAKESGLDYGSLNSGVSLFRIQVVAAIPLPGLGSSLSPLCAQVAPKLSCHRKRETFPEQEALHPRDIVSK
jgi:hypothetical protein